MNERKNIELLRKICYEGTRFSKEERSAVLQAISATEKQIPKIPDYEGDGFDDAGELIYDTAYCPNCRQDYEVDYDTPKYCKNCGQALDWSDDA